MAGIARGELEENYTTLGNLLSLCASLEMASCLRAIVAIKRSVPVWPLQFAAASYAGEPGAYVIG